MSISAFSQNIVRAAINDPGRVAKIYSKQEIYGVIDEMACDLLKGEPQAFAKACLDKTAAARAAVQGTPEGVALLKAYAMARSAPQDRRVEKVAPRSDSPRAPIIKRVDEIAKDIVSKERVTPARARVLAWERNPDIKRAHDDMR